jgi:hypothetical protein
LLNCMAGMSNYITVINDLPLLFQHFIFQAQVYISQACISQVCISQAYIFVLGGIC